MKSINTPDSIKDSRYTSVGEKLSRAAVSILAMGISYGVLASPNTAQADTKQKVEVAATKGAPGSIHKLASFIVKAKPGENCAVTLNLTPSNSHSTLVIKAKGGASPTNPMVIKNAEQQPDETMGFIFPDSGKKATVFVKLGNEGAFEGGEVDLFCQRFVVEDPPFQPPQQVAHINQ